MGKIETNLGAVMIVHSGAHDSALEYSRLRVVEYNSSSYISIQDVPVNIPISDTNYWRIICKGALQIWLEQGHAGNYADFIAWLQEPANSAAQTAVDTIDNIVSAVTEAETLRATAETNRINAENARVVAETARNVASNIYNVTLAVPLAAGQYYTSTTARAAVPTGVRKRGLEVVYETAAGVWYQERFIGTDIANWTTAGNWEKMVDKSSITPDFGTDTEKVISQKGYTDDLKVHLPTAVYTDRVSTDSGTIRNRHLLNAMYDDALNLLPNTELWYNFECGIKTRISGLNTYVTKVYDLSTNNRDGLQSTAEVYQPYLVGNINPANRYAIWGRERYFAFSQPIIKSGSDQWSMSIIANSLSLNSPFVYPTTGGAIFFYDTYIYFVNKFGAAVAISHPIQNCISRYYFVAKNGTLQFYLNGKLLGSAEINTAIDIDNLYVRDANIYDFRIFNKALNKFEIEFLDAKMSAFYPQFEGVEIGSQFWEASNAMDTIAPDGTVIPEVTDDAAWAALTTPAWCYYNNSEANGAVYGRIYNGYAVQKLTGSPIWRAPMCADFTQLATFLGGDAVVGGKLKAEGLTYWECPNTGATNESGFAAIAGGGRTANGGYQARASRLHLSTLDAKVGDRYGYAISSTGTGILVSGYYELYTIAGGQYLRRLRRVPPGENLREISSGMFSFPITSGAFKDITIPNMYKITGVKVTSAQALTNFTLEARTSAGVLVQNLLSGKSIGAGKSIIFSVVADMEVMLQDYIVRATAVGNGGAGMEIELIIEKIKV